MLTDRPVVFESLKMMQTKHFIDGHLNTIIVNNKLISLAPSLGQKTCGDMCE